MGRDLFAAAAEPQEPPRRRRRQGDLSEAKRARDEGMSKAARRAGSKWMEHGLSLIALMAPTRCIFEHIKHVLRDQGLPEPPSSHAWGALCKAAIHRKLITPTGKVGHPKDVASHASAKMIYWVGPPDERD